jgi:hypothetical protein
MTRPRKTALARLDEAVTAIAIAMGEPVYRFIPGGPKWRAYRRALSALLHEAADAATEAADECMAGRSSLIMQNAVRAAVLGVLKGGRK